MGASTGTTINQEQQRPPPQPFYHQAARPQYHQQQLPPQHAQMNTAPPPPMQYQSQQRAPYPPPGPPQAPPQQPYSTSDIRAYGPSAMGSGHFQRKGTIGTQTVKKIKADVHIDRKTFKVLPNPHDPQSMSVVFTYYSTSPANMMVILACQQERKPDGSSVFKATQKFPAPLQYKIDGMEKKFPEGVIKVDLRIYSIEALTTVRQGQYYPIVFFMHSNQEKDSLRNILCCSFQQPRPNQFEIKVEKHTIYYNGHYYNTEEIFGLDDTEQGEQMEEEGDAGQNLCIICFCELKDTIIIPCRHLCVCLDCAKTLSSQPPARRLCPICRQSMQSYMKLKGD